MYVDDTLHSSKNPSDFTDRLANKHNFKFKHVGELDYFLGANIERNEKAGNKLRFGSRTYIAKILENYQRMFGELPKHSKCPMEPGDHPEIDESPLLAVDGIKKYQSLMEMLQWAVILGMIDIFCAVMTMGSFRAMPREGHLKRLKKICGYLRDHKEAFITYKMEIPDYSMYEVVKYDWGEVYADSVEELPPDMPEPKGKPVRTTTFVDANLMHDLTNGKSVSGIIHMINLTPTDWYCKKQNRVESATYGSEFMAARIAIEQIIEMRYTLRMMGVPLDGPSWLFRDNESVIVSSTVPTSTLKKRHNSISYHLCQEAIALSIVNFIHISGDKNPTDMLTNTLEAGSAFHR